MSGRKASIVFDKAQRALNTNYAVRKNAESPLNHLIGRSLADQISLIHKEFQSVAFIGSGAEYFFDSFSSSKTPLVD